MTPEEKEKYKKIGSIPDRLVEEGAEVIGAICEMVHAIQKGHRFGFKNYHPNDPKKISNTKLACKAIIKVREEFKQFEELAKNFEEEV